MNLNPDNYYIEKRKYSGGLIINGGEASPFAVVIFRHRDPSQWYSGFRSQNLEWLTAYFERGNCEEETFADSETTEEGDIEFPFESNIEDGDISFNPDELERMTPSQPSETEDDIPF